MNENEFDYFEASIKKGKENIKSAKKNIFFNFCITILTATGTVLVAFLLQNNKKLFMAIFTVLTIFSAILTVFTGLNYFKEVDRVNELEGQKKRLEIMKIEKERFEKEKEEKSIEKKEEHKQKAIKALDKTKKTTSKKSTSSSKEDTKSNTESKKE